MSPLSDVQHDVNDQRKANLLALGAWFSKLAADSKRERPSLAKDPALMRDEGKWMDAPDMFQHVHEFLVQGAHAYAFMHRPANPLFHGV